MDRLFQEEAAKLQEQVRKKQNVPKSVRNQLMRQIRQQTDKTMGFASQKKLTILNSPLQASKHRHGQLKLFQTS